MKPLRLSASLAIVAASALALAACGSDNNSPSTTSSASTGASSAATSGGTTASGGITCASGTLNLAGSTAQGTAISAWTKAYQEACSGATVNNGAGGSGAGVTAFTNKTVDFAGSDYPLSAAQKPMADAACGTGGAIDIPMVPGGIALGYNLSGVTTLKLKAATIAEIFDGKITTWNDPAIAADNAGVTLPSTKIVPFSRSDTSGTSFNFSNYLTNVAKGTWTLGADKQWPAASVGQAAKGSSAVAQAVKTTPGAIGYFEDSFATQAGLPVAQVGRMDGSFATLTGDAVTSFLGHATPTTGATGNDLPLTFDYTTSDGYPITLVTYEIVCATPTKNAALLKDFLTYTAGSGQGILAANGYVPLPTAVQTKVQAAVAAL